MLSTVCPGDGRIPSLLPPPPQPLLSAAEESRVGRAKVHARAVNNVAIANHATICILPLSRVVLVACTRVTAKRIQTCEHTRAQIQLGSSQPLQPLRVTNYTIRRHVTIKSATQKKKKPLWRFLTKIFLLVD